MKKAKAKAKAKPPRLAELQEIERKHRGYLESSAEHYAYGINLPDIDAADEEELDSAEYEVEDPSSIATTSSMTRRIGSTPITH